MTSDGIDPRLLMVIKGVSLVAYTGLIFLCPPLLTAKLIAVAERAAVKIIGDSLLTWAEDMVDSAMDDLLGDAS